MVTDSGPAASVFWRLAGRPSRLVSFADKERIRPMRDDGIGSVGMVSDYLLMMCEGPRPAVTDLLRAHER